MIAQPQQAALSVGLPLNGVGALIAAGGSQSQYAVSPAEKGAGIASS